MGRFLNIVTSLRKATKRNYAGRMMDDKVNRMLKAKECYLLPKLALVQIAGCSETSKLEQTLPYERAQIGERSSSTSIRKT